MFTATVSYVSILQRAQLRSASEKFQGSAQKQLTAGKRNITHASSLSEEQTEARAQFLFSRRAAASATVLALSVTQPAHAIGFKKELKKKRVTSDMFVDGPEYEFRNETQPGLKFYDLEEGVGPVIEKGDTITVHYDCKFRGLTVVSSREGRLLGGNRSIAQPFTFKVGKIPSEYQRVARKDYFTGVGLKVGKDIQNSEFYVEGVTKGTPAERAGLVRNDKLVSVDGTSVAGIPTSEVGSLLQGEEGTKVTLIIQRAGAEESTEVELTRERYAVKQEFKAFAPEQSGGLYTGSSGVKPPAALYVAALGMKKGGKRTVQVPGVVAYGEDGYNEIPENSDITMEIEVLNVA